jgi:hypothetical protein
MDTQWPEILTDKTVKEVNTHCTHMQLFIIINNN